MSTRRRIFEAEHDLFRESVVRFIRNGVALQVDDWRKAGDALVPYSGYSYYPCEIWRIDPENPCGSITCEITKWERVAQRTQRGVRYEQIGLHPAINPALCPSWTCHGDRDRPTIAADQARTDRRDSLWHAAQETKLSWSSRGVAPQ